MGYYESQVVPRVVDVALSGKPMQRLRRRACEGLSGDVLELGFGSGRNLPHYPWTLCTVPDVDQAVCEVRRVVRPQPPTGATVRHLSAAPVGHIEARL